ncbi:hypothetical protein PQX77_009132 [Marasmius sp. AFHP31]|nr:hypothetical protein PQX77_009132 [Marasmius sp. AFHP31]
MPLDVLYTIFSFLPPKSLFSLTRSNRLFRSTLLSPEAVSVWTRVRKSCEAPDPWEEMDEVQWVRLLLGNTNCSVSTLLSSLFFHVADLIAITTIRQFCGAKSVRKIEFMLMARVCFACVKANGVSQAQLKRDYPNEHKLFMDLVQPTGGTGSQRTRYYNRQEIDRVLEQIRKCVDEVELETFVKERKAYLKRLVAHADLCYKWAAGEPERKAKDVNLMRAERFAAIKKRLKELGFVDQDIEGIRDHSEVTKDRPLTERTWAQLKPDLSESVLSFRVARLLSDMRNPLDTPAPLALSAPSGQTQHPSFLISRCNLVTQYYISYKRSLTLTKWRQALLPSVEAVWCLPSMRRLIALPDETEVTLEMAENPSTMVSIDIFANELRVGMNYLKKRVTGKYNYIVQNKGDILKNWIDTDEVKSPDWRKVPWDLAAVQGRCSICRKVLSSVLMSIRHSTGPCFLKSDANFLESMKFDMWSYSGALDIFWSRSAAGLVWATLGAERMCHAKASEMDERGKWYRCLRYTDGSFVGTWRECIIHPFEEKRTSSPSKHEDIQDQGRDNPVFQILTQEEVRGMNLKDERECWSCARCTVNAERLWTREVVTKHLRDEHQILESQVPRDFFYAAPDEA